MAPDAPKGTKLEFETSGTLKGTSIVAAQKGTTVSVENLFNNLPVRRRELERKIKTEWGRVVGVLGQYACIQTGIKFSVTQQAGKGKKTTLFSTKGNQSTKENIINVFGAKTLTALVPLDLNLEVEPTSAPSQRWSTQEDGGKKDIRIVGHISRPASGEGRQTPDRQMFFVNGRPCGLPQVAKAFNEVYKSYNAFQSPFIFANIELDTHMYDVNVSPDKRTILLHDQPTMLENLKTALIELFESQDYTVPISQLPAQQLPSYKQLTISRESNALTQPAQALIDPAEVGESEDGCSISRRELSTDDDRQEKPYKPTLRHGAAFKESTTRDSGAVDLISNWLGRNAEDRTDRAQRPQTPKVASEGPMGLSKEKRKLIDRLEKEGEQSSVPNGSPDDPDCSVTTTEGSNVTSSNEPDLPVPEANEASALSSQPKDADEEVDGRSDAHIPALQSPSKITRTVSNVLPSSARQQRVPAEIAAITIGDHNVISSIGTPCPKRPRNDNAAAPNARGSESRGKPLPSFGCSLSQRFAAPGTVQQSTASAEESDEGNPVTPPSSQLLESPVGTQECPGDAEISGERPSSVTDVKVEEMDSSILNPDIDEDEEYLDEATKRAAEEAKTQAMIQVAEESAAQPSGDHIMRSKSLLKGGTKRKDSTVSLVRYLNTNPSKIGRLKKAMEERLEGYRVSTAEKAQDEALDSKTAEQKLSLTISKSDFAKMKIIGQFNLGFILASRSSSPQSDDGPQTADDLFIIDQHASDEKYNFERLQATTIVQSQRLVHPKTLDLTAMEEEILIENLSTLETNGFIVTIDESGESPIGQRCQLVSLPLSRETAFSLTDIDELLALLSDAPPGTIPRPSKVRKMFAMRACRSSIMIGRNLSHKQMGKIVKHMGELDKPWNCPHGRPTMRHLSGLSIWDELGWKEYGDQEDDTAGVTD